MKKLISLSLSSCILALCVTSARATLTTWDPQGTTGANPYTGNMSGTWESSLWSTSETGQATPQAWVENTAALFAVHSGAGTPAFTVTMNANHTVAGFFNGPLTPDPCPVTIVGTGIMTLGPANLNGFAVSSDTGDPGSIVISNVITGGANAGLCAEDAGQIYLNATNTYVGGTYLGFGNSSGHTLFDGIVNFNNSNSFGAGTNPIVFLYCGGAVGTVGAMVVEGSSAVTIPNPVINYEFYSGAASLNIVGNPAGVTFSGPWTLTGGTQIGIGGGIYATNGTLLTTYPQVSIGSGAAANNLVIISGPITDTNTFNKFGVGILELTGTNAFTGAISNVAGTLTIGGSGSLNGATYAGNITNAATLIFNSSSNQTWSGVISGTGTLSQAGPGTLILSGASTYTGNTTNSGGTLQVDATDNGTTGPLGETGSIVLSGGTLQYSSANSYDYSSRLSTLSTAYNIDVNGQSVTYATGMSATAPLSLTNSTGSGTLTLTTSESYSGATSINAGTLALGAGGSINPTPSISIAAGGTFDVSGADPYTLSSSTTLNASGTGTTPGTTAATINDSAVGGSISLGSQPIVLTYTPTAFTGDTAHPALYINQGTLSLSGNAFTVTNAGASPLGAGTYTLIQQSSGSISSSGSYTVSVAGNGLAAGATASISVSSGNVNLVVVSSVVPTPVINSFTRSGTNLIFSGTNGPDSGTYYVLTSTNVTTHLTNWTAIATNTFSPTGTFNVTNAIGTNSAQFFIIATP